MDNSPINWLRLTFLLVATLLAVFLQTNVQSLRFWLGAQFDLLPSLVVFASASGDWVAFLVCSIVGGLGYDAFSANPLGAAIIPLMIMGWVAHRSRELIVLQDRLVQALVGVAASVMVAVATIVLILTIGRQPTVGWITLWQCLVMAAGSAIATPCWFWLFPRLEKAFGYEVMSETSFRPDREIKRGRS